MKQVPPLADTLDHATGTAPSCGHGHAPAPEKAAAPSSGCGTRGDSCCAAPAAATPASTAPPAGVPLFRIATMDCAVEESEIRRALERIAGVRGLHFRLRERTLAIDAPEAVLASAIGAIRGAGFDPQRMDAAAASGTGPQPRFGASAWRLGLALAFALAAELLHLLAGDTLLARGLGLAVAVLAIGLSGIETYTKGFNALRHGRLNISALMTVAVTGAFLIGQWPEAAMVMALYAIAELIEARAADRARNAIEGLLALAPDTADVRQHDGSWQVTASAAVPLDAVVRIRPGERVPLDGVVTEGRSAIDQAPVTGESLPVEKTPGDTVFAGTINAFGELQFRVTAGAANTTLARIIHAVEQAQGTRAPTQRFVDRFAAVYTPAVFVLALAVALLTPWLLGIGWLDAIYKALVLLVVACPCALVISTPVTVVSALAAAARRGILIKGGTYLEQARAIKAVALDKTGTLTEGKPQLVQWDTLRAGADRAAIAHIAARLAGRSDHPVSRAIAQGLDAATGTVGDVTALPGRGVQGTIDGTSYVLGNVRLAEERGQMDDGLAERLAQQASQGRTVTLLADARGVLAFFAVADTLRRTSREAIAQLKALGVTAVMLTGDNAATAASIAAQAGIDDARGNLLPQDKLDAIDDLRRRYGVSAMTGDGINDAPALAQADIGFAMGGAGTDVAMEAADVVIMNDDLRRIPETIRLSRRTHGVLWQNITLALGIKAVFMVLALFGSATMWMAVFADMGATLLVVGNGLRLIRTRPAAGDAA